MSCTEAAVLLVRQQPANDPKGIAVTELSSIGLVDFEGGCANSLFGAGEGEAERSVGCHIRRILAKLRGNGASLCQIA